MAERQQIRPEQGALTRSVLAGQYLRGLKDILESRKVEGKSKKSGFATRKRNHDKYRLLISGRPASGKSSSLCGFEKPIRIIAAPGEHGSDSIPDDPDIDVSTFEEEPGDPMSSADVMLQFATTLFQEIDCQDYRTICIDGLHQLYRYFFDIVTDGKAFAGQSPDPRYYGLSHEMFRHLLGQLLIAPTPIIVATIWCEREPIHQDMTPDQVRDTRVMPYLPGKMALDVMGLFNTGIMHALVGSSCDVPGCEKKKRGEDHYLWQLTYESDSPFGDCSFKVPYTGPGLLHRIHQEWPMLKDQLTKARGM